MPEEGLGEKAAPGRLGVVQAFINTADLSEGSDELRDGAGLTGWLRRWQLEQPQAVLPDSDATQARALREALRSALVAHTHGDPVPPPTLQVLNEFVAAARLQPRFAEDGTSRLEPAAEGLAGTLGQLLAIVVEAIATGTWSRLKTCHDESCRWAFYDHTKNHSGAWCTMATCGNRNKGRAFRARRLKPTGSGSRA